MKPINVLVAENNPHVFFSVQNAVRSLKSFIVVGQSHTLGSGLERAQVVPVDLIIVNLDKNPAALDTMDSLKEQLDFLLIAERVTDQQTLRALKTGIWDILLTPYAYERLELSLKLYGEFFFRRNRLSTQPLQKDIDALFFSAEPCPTPVTNSAGNAEMTRKILSVIQKSAVPVSAWDISEELHMSRITVRKYCEALVLSGKLSTEYQHQSKGRPIKKYYFRR